MNEKFLKELLRIPSPSGNEELCIDAFRREWNSIPTYEDNMGNTVFSKGTGKQKILFSGHIDSVCLLVSQVLPSGALKVISGGGVDKKVLPGSMVTVLGDSGTEYPGVIGKKPIHLETSKERDAVPEMTELYVDLGCTKKEDLDVTDIHVGSPIVYHRGNTIMNFGVKGDLICSPDLDDKIGVFIASEVLKNIDTPTGSTIMAGAFVQEEVGLRGASLAASNLNPDISIDIDVTFDTSADSGINKALVGDVEVGKGPVIEFGADKSKEIAKELITVAKENDIPYQVCATKPGGTNTAAIQLRSSDCITMHLAIPVKNMHTPVEIVSKSDVENAIKLLTIWANDR